jgi:hypothetical protein
MSFLIFLHMTWLVHLYSNSGKNALAQKEDIFNAKEEGYEAVRDRPASAASIDEDLGGPESYELATQDEMRVPIGVDWMDSRK